jgi:hypothetical protein
MVTFARLIMRDNGLAIHVNPEHVTQIRQTIEGEPAIYISGRETPMIVEGTLEAALRKLDAASAGLTVLVNEEPPVAVREFVTPNVLAKIEPPPLKPAAKRGSTPVKKAAKPKPDRKKKPAIPAPESETTYPGASWFRGGR